MGGEIIRIMIAVLDLRCDRCGAHIVQLNGSAALDRPSNGVMAPMTVHRLNAGTVRLGDDFERGERAAVPNVGGEGFNAASYSSSRSRRLKPSFTRISE